MRLEHLTEKEEAHWRTEFAQQNWIFGALALSVTLPEFAGGDSYVGQRCLREA